MLKGLREAYIDQTQIQYMCVYWMRFQKISELTKKNLVINKYTLSGVDICMKSKNYIYCHCGH